MDNVENNIKQSLLLRVKSTYKKLTLVFNIISVIIMLIFPIFNILNVQGNKYINIGVLVVTLIYGITSIIIGSKKKYKINRIYKWARILLSTISLAINIYSIYITVNNYNMVTFIINAFMILTWFLNVSFNLMYDITTYKLNKLIESKKEDIQQFKDNLVEATNNFKNKNFSKNKEVEKFLEDHNIKDYE